MKISRIHHVAIICSQYEVSKSFYVNVLGLRIIAENYRENRRSWKLDLALPDGGQIELFSFPDAPERPSFPEAQGLRHLAFAVSDLDDCIQSLKTNGITPEETRIDEFTGARFLFSPTPMVCQLSFMRSRNRLIRS